MLHGKWAAVPVVAGLLASASAPLTADTPSSVLFEPLRPAGAQPAQTVSEVETTIRIDASRGAQVWAPVRAEIILRPDGAPFTKALIESSVKQDDLDRRIRRAFFDLLLDAERNVASISEVSWSVDDAGSLHMVMNGETKLFWQRRPGSPSSRDVEGSKPNLSGAYFRRTGAQSDAPFKVAFPTYAAWHVTVLLPKDGQGVTVVGDDINRKVGGLEIRRFTTVNGGVLAMEASVRSLVSEISYPEAKAAEPVLKQISETAVTMIAAENLFTEQRRQADVLAAEPLVPEDNFDRARVLLETRQPALALVSIDKALAAGMQGPGPYSLKGDVLRGLRQPVEARLNYETALEKRPSPTLEKWIKRSLAQIDLAENKPKDALLRLDPLIAAYPRDVSLLAVRAVARAALNDIQGALADVDAGLKIDPSATELVRLREALAKRS
jgi:tetratricopeptide (TPR) repeat protein